MSEIETYTNELVKAIRESEEYLRFCRIRDKVGENPELRRKINDFRRQVFEVQNSKDSMDMYEEMQRISREYEEFQMDPLVEEFLQSELRVCRIIQDINLKIVGSVDLDTQDVTAGL